MHLLLHCVCGVSAGDCFELGRIAYNRGDHYHVVMWMGQALELYNAETNKTVDHIMLLDYLAYSLYMVSLAECPQDCDPSLADCPVTSRTSHVFHF